MNEQEDAERIARRLIGQKPCPRCDTNYRLDDGRCRECAQVDAELDADDRAFEERHDDLAWKNTGGNLDQVEEQGFR